MKNAQYWMEYLERLAEGQERGTIKPVQAVEMNNTVGKVISLAKATLEAQRMKSKVGGSMKTIQALDMGEETPPALSEENVQGMARRDGRPPCEDGLSPSPSPSC